MPLVTTKELLLDAQANGYAVGAFNVENMEMVQAVAAAAEELRSPVIMQTTPSTVRYAGLDYFYANVRAAAEKAGVPIVMHLDHGSSYELAMQAYRTGYTSIMIDGSHGNFEENIEVSRAVANACHPSGIPVEAELGKVGGKEDDLGAGIHWQLQSGRHTEFTKEFRSWMWSGFPRSDRLFPFHWSSTEHPGFQMKRCRSVLEGESAK